MRTSTIIGWFALSLPAQVGQDPFAAVRQELAEAVAVEEQEHDLGKAEGMLRALLEKGTLSVQGKAYAALRLGLLLQRLGRGEEATGWLKQAEAGGIRAEELAKARGNGGQDPERLAALRDKARTLVREVLGQGQAAYSDPLWGIAHTQAAEQLLWIGAAAVPEVIAALDAESARFDRNNYGRAGATSGLAAFLWRVGGDEAAAFLTRCTEHADATFREAVAAAAFQAEHEQMLAVVHRFLRDPDPTGRVVSALLGTRSNQRGPETMLENRLPPDAIVEAALAGPVAGRPRLLIWARNYRELSSAMHERLLVFLREALRSTDPALGQEAQKTLFSPLVRRSVAGLEVVLAELPEVPSDKVVRYENRRDAFTDAEVRQLVPALLRCAERLGNARTPNARHEWLQAFCRLHGGHVFDVATVLRLVDLGYPLMDQLEGDVTPQNAVEVFARFDRVGDQPRLLATLQAVDLPPDLFPALRAKAEEVRQTGRWQASEWPMHWWADTLVCTGHVEAADWILAEWQRVPGDWPARSLVRLGRRNQDERVRAAMRTIVASLPIMTTSGGPAGSGGGGPNRSVSANRQRSDLMKALLRMSDVPALDLIQSDSPLEELAFVVQGKAEPGHRYTDDQVIALLRRVSSAGPRLAQQVKPDLIPDRVLCELGRLSIEGGDPVGQTWLKHITRRISDRAPESQGRAELVAFLDKLLASDSEALRRRALSSLGNDDVALCQPAIEARLNDSDSQCAAIAFTMLCATGIAHGDAWLQRGLKNQHAIVRARTIERLAMDLGEAAEKHVLPLAKDESMAVRLAAANYFGSIVSKAAVPDLIAMLRDAEGDVRQAAADALTKIRFFHEQQAHWDRVLKGLDASPASAAEKLLLQAKPGAPREQRLLALRSLGVLGRPEALPFLIEWSQDHDADIAAAARAATLQILQTGGAPAVK
ncbi:MAG: HEAT repeat domain-containing protein [Planctomycetes bacterium]|nr:HEAT repeat domain-containing protein [Planctomycetota bacterium]